MRGSAACWATQSYARAFTGPGKAKPQGCCDLCLTSTHSTHSTTQCPLYFRRPGRPRLAPRSPPRSHPPLLKSALTITGGSVPTLTAGVVTCVLSRSVEAHTKPCTVLAGARHPGSCDYSTAHTSPSPSPFSSPHYSLLFTHSLCPAVITRYHAHQRPPPRVTSTFPLEPCIHFLHHAWLHIRVQHWIPRHARTSPHPQPSLLPESPRRHHSLLGHRVRGRPYSRSFLSPPSSQLHHQPPWGCPQEAVREVEVDYAPITPTRW